MTEFIVRLTDEQEQLVRRYVNKTTNLSDVMEIAAVSGGLLGQVANALALYDQLVAEAKAKSDD